MKAIYRLDKTTAGSWRIRHSSSTLGDVELTDRLRETLLTRMQAELQYRLELCPCSGVSAGTVELELHDDSRVG